jgi:hypothetical protein
MSRLAQVWRRSWNRSRWGSPARATAGLKTPATNFCSRSGPPCGAVNTRSSGRAAVRPGRRRAARRGSEAEARCGGHRSWAAPTPAAHPPRLPTRQPRSGHGAGSGAGHEAPPARRLEARCRRQTAPAAHSVGRWRRPGPRPAGRSGSARPAGRCAAAGPQRQGCGRFGRPPPRPPGSGRAPDGRYGPGRGTGPCSTSPAIHSRTASVSISPRLARAKAGRIW